MPGFQFTMDDIKALLTYIDSMSPADARYLSEPTALDHDGVKQ
jgi:hypothetical protein